MVCYTEVANIQKIFHMHSNLLGPTKQSVIKRFSLFGKFVMSSFTVHGPFPMVTASDNSY